MRRHDFVMRLLFSIAVLRVTNGTVTTTSIEEMVCLYEKENYLGSSKCLHPTQLPYDFSMGYKSIVFGKNINVELIFYANPARTIVANRVMTTSPKLNFGLYSRLVASSDTGATSETLDQGNPASDARNDQLLNVCLVLVVGVVTLF